MAKPPKLDDPVAQASELGLAEKLLMFSIASRTEWERAGIISTTVVATMIKERSSTTPAVNSPSSNKGAQR